METEEENIYLKCYLCRTEMFINLDNINECKDTVVEHRKYKCIRYGREEVKEYYRVGMKCPMCKSVSGRFISKKMVNKIKELGIPITEKIEI